jgi:hypothetical protein
MLIAVPLVRIFINSGTAFSTGELASMPLTLAEGAATAVGSAWPLVAPLVGALGAFAAGSNTISNIMFSQFQFATADGIGVATVPVVAVQAVGGAAGNMLTVHNVVAAAATVGLVGREGDLMRKVAIPCTYYLLAGGDLQLPRGLGDRRQHRHRGPRPAAGNGGRRAVRGSPGAQVAARARCAADDGTAPCCTAPEGEGPVVRSPVHRRRHRGIHRSPGGRPPGDLGCPRPRRGGSWEARS